jgi:nicotinate dehydrogenase subunit B
MTRPPVETVRQANDLWFPFNQRWLMRFWNLLFLDPAPLQPDPRHDAAWNRGRYLVAGIGHCGACHTPRNLLGAEAGGHALGGGVSAGWTAPALDAGSPAPVPWSAAQIFGYLREGRDAAHGAAAGPMQEITDSLAGADPADLHAIAAYLASLQGGRKPMPRRAAPRAADEALGAAIFAGACAECHGGGEPMLPPHGIDLSHSTPLAETDPRDAIQIVLAGIEPPAGQAGPAMPGFADSLTDSQLAALLAYIRAHYGSGPAWAGLEAKVRELRQGREGG